MKWIRSLLVVFFVLGVGVFAQQQPLTTIAEIRFEGLAATSYNDALAAIRLRPGDVFDQRGLNQAVKDLNALQRFRSVRVATTQRNTGIVVTFTVSEESLIDRVIFRGVSLGKSSKVKELNDLSSGRAFREARARTAVYRIKEYYRTEGFLEADVQYRIEPVAQLPGYFDLIYTIVEGPKIVVRNIEIQGAVKVRPKKILGVMQTRKQQWVIRSGVLKEEEFLADRERILALYRKNGYFDAEVTNFTWTVEDVPTVNGRGEVTKVTRGIVVRVAVSEGEQYTAGNFSFEGYNVLTRAELERYLTLKEGDVYDQEKIEMIRTAIYQKYSDNGYLFANVSTLQPKRDGRIIDTVFVITEGKRSHINNIIITGNWKTYPSVIRHLIQVSEGEIFVSRKVEQSLNRLGQTQFFADVRPVPQPSAVDGLIDLEFAITENPTGQIELNGGWGTVSGFVVGVKVAEKNLGGRGWYLSIRGEYGQFRQLGEVTFTNPFIFLSPFSFSITAGVYNTIYTSVPADENGDGIIDGTSINYIDNPNSIPGAYSSASEYTRLQFRLGFSFGAQFAVYWNAAVGFDFNIFLDYQAKNLTRPLIFDNGWRLDQELIDSFGFGWTIQNTLYFTLRFNNTDGGLWPTRGISTGAYVGFSGFGLGGNIHFIALNANFDFYYRLFSIPSFGKELKVTWVFHYDMGFLLPYLNGLFDFRDANRQSFDGVYRMRGWINFAVRGQSLSYFSMELRFPVWEFLGLVGFMDIGAIFSEYNQFSFNTSGYIMSMGLGLAINLPILPIRLYVARPFEWRDGTFRPTDSGDFWKDWQFVFSIQGLF
ncbi:MAG: outer membrane protein assembly factor BamA [Brevinema sp.]